MVFSEERDETNRLSRILKIILLLCRSPGGLSVADIARECRKGKRTIYRDLIAIQEEQGIPLYDDKGKWKVREGHFLPPVHFTVSEVLNIYLAARLMLHFNRRYDPNIAALFLKINAVVPSPLKDHIQRTVEWLQKQPHDDHRLKILSAVADAWMNGHQVRITYRGFDAEKATERIIDPYFIEPASSGHASYVIAFCHYANAIRTFKIERIEEATLLASEYANPDFDANRYLESAWGIISGDDVVTIRLKFDPQISRIIEETTWHPAQQTKKMPNGAVILTLKLAYTDELKNWILGWGSRVVVLEPEEIRRDLVTTFQEALKNYEQGQLL